MQGNLESYIKKNFDTAAGSLRGIQELVSE